MARLRIFTALVFAAHVSAALNSARAETPSLNAAPGALTASLASPSTPVTAQENSPSELLSTSTSESGGIVRLSTESSSPSESQPNTSVGQSPIAGSLQSMGNWTAGADFLLVRPHFSEATAFVKGTETASTYQATAQSLDFQYSPSFRVFAGYRFDEGGSELKLTYTRLTAQTQSDAGNISPGHFIVDPFGNVVGTAIVIDPSNAQFGQPLVGGDHIQASASVDVNVFDIDLVKPLTSICGGWELKYTAGVRIAQIHQMYQSVITDSGTFFSGGEYAAEFVGAGPRVGLQAQRSFSACRQFSLFANTYGSLLVGEYDENFAQTATAPSFQATQYTNEIRVLPVAEAEIGAGWSPYPWLNVSAGWLFQVWFDLGGSGGTFGGFYTVTENANIMAFEGLFVHADLTF
jgi:hypothetical protein